MLYRIPIKELKAGSVSKKRGYSVIAMRFYPRFVNKAWVDEYLRALAPEAELFGEFKAKEKELGDHDQAFDRVNYEERFTLTPEGMEHLERLANLSNERDVYLFCQCSATQKCHTDLLLLLAKHKFGARIATVRSSYPKFESRIS